MSPQSNPSPAAEPSAAESNQHYDFTYTQNRELSWLQFDNRVLEEARDERVPLLERFKMAAIFESNLDEFVMIRVGSLGELASLKRQPIDNKSNQTPDQQVTAIFESLPPLIRKHDETVAALEEELSGVGIQRVGWADFTTEDMVVAENFFDDMVLPVASPQIFFVVFLNISNAFKAFGQIKLLTEGGPNNATNTLIYSMYKNALLNGRYETACVQAILLFLIIFIVTRVQHALEERTVFY